ncbi:membrane-bound lytic murein transglycosylase MltF [Thioalkalivibrio sulfidiphilus]|uniref:membrane-bound lytic murein transglycosylase MltF n=1 Tax=Thioalkalivibrio sulfidiphilus TaxID=1033854 RepID=UPI003B33D2A4
MKLYRRQLTDMQRLELLGFLILVAITLLFAFNNPRSALDRVLDRGELVVAMRVGPTTYFSGPDGVTGFEYELAQAFAERLGVRLRVVVPDRFEEILPMVERGRVDLAAAGITVTEQRRQQVRFGPAYKEVTEQLVYRMGRESRPRTLADPNGQTLGVLPGSTHASRLSELQSEFPELNWQETAHGDIKSLLREVWRGGLELAVADSVELASLQRFYPELRAAFDISEPRSLAWALPRVRDDSLYDQVLAFFEEIRENGWLEQLLERHFGHVEVLDYVGTVTFVQQVDERLSEYLDLFKEAAELHGMDWRLLAAISYQESHWNPRAVSPTGVRGMMMLTQNTAAQLGVSNRMDPRESVMGGAEYFRHMHSRIPDRIPEPDRTWLALAAYNVGLGHLEDARRLTEGQGRNPDRWMDVMAHLPLLAQENWYRRTRFGYARGWEPVIYVQNIRSYYDLLVWMTDESGGRPPPLPKIEPLNILPPGL